MTEGLSLSLSFPFSPSSMANDLTGVSVKGSKGRKGVREGSKGYEREREA